MSWERLLLLLKMTKEKLKVPQILVRMCGIGGSGCFSHRHNVGGDDSCLMIS